MMPPHITTQCTEVSRSRLTCRSHSTSAVGNAFIMPRRLRYVEAIKEEQAAHRRLEDSLADDDRSGVGPPGYHDVISSPMAATGKLQYSSCSVRSLSASYRQITHIHGMHARRCVSFNSILRSQLRRVMPCIVRIVVTKFSTTGIPLVDDYPILHSGNEGRCKKVPAEFLSLTAQPQFNAGSGCVCPDGGCSPLSPGFHGSVGRPVSPTYFGHGIPQIVQGEKVHGEAV